EARAERDLPLRRLWTIADLTLATLRGIVRFHLPTDPRGFDAIDDYDCREWLRLHGASEQSVGSGYLRGLYDLGFSYEDGDPARPRIAAGQALRSMMRAFFTYRGSFFWRMQAGMGDVVFAPLYEVLRRRAVGLGAVPYVCREIVARDPRWRAMVERVKTVATQAFQVWMTADMAALGWSGPQVSLSGFVEPFDTWADMRHLIARERWPEPP